MRTQPGRPRLRISPRASLPGPCESVPPPCGRPSPTHGGPAGKVVTSPMLSIDLTGRRALVAGVADDAGFGFSIAKALAEAGATICLGTWPPALNIFQNLLERGKLDASLTLSRSGKLAFERIYPLDAAFDTLEDAPAELRESKRYRERGDFSIQGVAARIREDFGPQGLDIVV